MSVLALITKPEEAPRVVPWAAQFARARQTKLVVLCWAYTPAAEFPLLAEDAESGELTELASAVSNALDTVAQSIKASQLPEFEIQKALHADSTAAALAEIRRSNAQLLIASSPDPSGDTGYTYDTNPLLRQSPCTTVVLFGGRDAGELKKIFVALGQTAHDRTMLTLAASLSQATGATATVALEEEDTGDEAEEVGKRELRQIMRDAGIEESRKFRPQVVLTGGKIRNLFRTVSKHDLAFAGVGKPRDLRRAIDACKDTTIGIVKRAPPLKSWSSTARREWLPRISPADYADMIQSLRRGSKCSFDYLCMLGLAAAIASLGLLQDSPAVVIGSMLLAPLMTPMVGSGLALAQANANLARTSARAISVGFLLCLALSYVIGAIMPGTEISAQVAARGSPNLLDLFIAFASGIAAAYAMARPSLLGAIAGVAIAVALVPPLCSVGISIAYRSFDDALGASVLFLTNVVAIVLAAATTFRAMGVTTSRVASGQRKWVGRAIGALAIVALLLALPLEISLNRMIREGRPQNLASPVAKAVLDAVLERLDQDPEVQLMFAGRPAREDKEVDVMLYITSPRPLPVSYRDELIGIVRNAMNNQEARVFVFCVQDFWEDSTPPPATTSAATD